ILRVTGSRSTFLDFTGSIRGRLLRILEINGAGNLSAFFRRMSRTRRLSYPEIDMTSMTRINDRQFDLVVHSDTLEHVPDPVKGVSECRRVLRDGGACCFTVPIVVGRLGRRRDGLPKSYHGAEGDNAEDYTVITEYGADAWRQILEAGFSECRIVAV